MLTQDLRERIRRAYYIDHKSIRQISGEVGHSRDTISRVVSENPPDASQRPRRNKPSPVFGPFQQRIDELMERNERLPKKQRYTGNKIFEVLHSEGYQGCDSRVRQYIAAWKRVHEAPDKSGTQAKGPFETREEAATEPCDQEAASRVVAQV